MARLAIAARPERLSGRAAERGDLLHEVHPHASRGNASSALKYAVRYLSCMADAGITCTFGRVEE